MELNNKKIILTGAGSGIGRELAIQLINKGAKVAALDINEAELNITKTMVKLPENITLHKVDVSSEESMYEFKTEYMSLYNNEIDIIINNAGIIQPFVTLDKLEDSAINRVMNVNFYGPLKLTRLFLNEIKNRPEGYIVNISSMGGFFPFPGQTIYGASKAALKLFTEGLYAELLGSNVHVSIVFPGAIATNIMKNSNVEMIGASDSKMKMLSASKAASIIIKGIEKNKFQMFVGNDSKFMHFMYKLNPEKAIKFIKKQMNM